MKHALKALCAAVAVFASFGVSAQEATIRKALAERLPNLPKIDEISKSPIKGLYEVRFNGTEILYSDENGDFVLAGGAMIDTKTRTDLTEARIEKLLAIAYDQLPVKDAIEIKQGNGSRKMAVFVDPNCGYCKRFERDIAGLKDVTIHTFLIPILGADSQAKSRDIWCAKDQVKVWRAFMLDNVAPPKADAKCDTAAITRNLNFARGQRINATPALIFADGSRKSGAIPAEQVERLLAGKTAGADAAPKK